MKKQLFSFFLIVFVFSGLKARYEPLTNIDSLRIDSLKMALLTAKEIDHAKIYNTLADIYNGTNPKKAEEYAITAKEYAINCGNNEMLEEAFFQLSYAYRTRNLETALGYLNKSLGINKKTKNKKSLFVIYGQFSDIYVEMGLYSKAFEYHLLLLQEAKKIGDKKKILRGLINTGVGYAEFKDFDKAIESYNKAIQLSFNMFNDSLNENILLCWLNIGCLQYHLEDYDLAISYITKALNGYKITNSSRLKDATYFLGYAYYRKSDYNKAIELYKKALGYYYEYDKSIEIACLHEMGHVLTIQNKYDSALYYIERGLQFSIELNNYSYIEHNYHALSKIYGKTGNYKKAYKYHKLYLEIKDSLQTAEKINKVKYLEQSYEIQQQEQELKLLHHKEKNQKLIIYLILSFLVILIVLVLFIIKNMQFKRRSLQNEKNRLLVENEKQGIEKELGLEKRERLKEQLRHRERELNNKLRLIAGKNIILNHIYSKLKIFKSRVSNDNLRYEFEDINKLIKENIDQHKDWEMFKSDFEEIHPGFIKKLIDSSPEVSITDIKLCVYTRMQFSSKEVAELLNILPASVKNARTRLKNKLNLTNEGSLAEVLKRM